MSRSSSNFRGVRQRRAAVLAATLGLVGLVTSASVTGAVEFDLHDDTPALPAPSSINDEARYAVQDGRGLAEVGMLESDSPPAQTLTATADTLLPQADQLASESFEPPTSVPLELEIAADNNPSIPASAFQEGQPFLIDYATALAMIGGQHPAVGFAQARVRAAYADLAQAKALWLPSIRAGVSYHHLGGNVQGSNGAINDIDRSSLQAGLGAGAVGAGTTPRPGIVAEFQVSDAIFTPRIAERTVWAQRHAQTSAFQQQLLEVALAYNDLLLAYQETQVVQQSRQRTSELAELTTSFAEAGEGLQADADRMRTELKLIESRVWEATERREIAQNRLIQALSLDCVSTIQPADPQLTPIHLVETSVPRGQLISVGLSQRPELKEQQCVVAATIEEYKRQKYAPLLPSVLMGVSQTGFGGGLGNSINNVDPRTDVDVLAVWQLRNLGFGERAARSRAAAASHQAKHRELQEMDRVAREIADGHSQIVNRAQQIAILQSAIDAASDSNQRNLSRIKDGEGLPLEVLQSLQALEQSQLSYARAVARHNEAQFRLQWALGWPIHGSSM